MGRAGSSVKALPPLARFFGSHTPCNSSSSHYEELDRLGGAHQG